MSALRLEARVRGLGRFRRSSACGTKAALRDHYDPLFPIFETDYPDQLRADEFLREFDEL